MTKRCASLEDLAIYEARGARAKTPDLYDEVLCMINDKVCNIIIYSGSNENIVLKALVSCDVVDMNLCLILLGRP